MTRDRWVRGGIAAAALAVTASVGLAAGLLLQIDETPATLATAAPVGPVPVTQREYDDRRTVELALSLEPESSLASSASGRITALTCHAGSTFASGASNISIDGSPALNLATAVPLWRDLTHGDRGADVGALQDELRRLGHDVAPDGVFGRSELRAVRDLLAAPKDPELASGLPASRVLWLPAPEVTVTACEATTGAEIAAGDPIGTLNSGLAGAAISRMPDALVDGERVVTVEGDSYPVDATGRISDPDALATLSASDAFMREMRAESTTLSAAFVLAAPIPVSVLPPAALYALDGGHGCVTSDGEPLAVRIMGSELGQTFAVFETDTPPKTIDFSPQSEATCR